MKILKTYKARTLFDGNVIGKEGKYVGVPNSYKHNKIKVVFGDSYMMVDKWLNADGYRVFPDKFGRKDANGNTRQFTLGYFPWKPLRIKTEIDEWMNR